jgi:hypothetical protein
MKLYESMREAVINNSPTIKTLCMELFGNAVMKAAILFLCIGD